MAPKSSKPQAHGLTHGEMKELQEAQINDERFSKEMSGNVDSNYKFDAHEKNFVHAKLQNPGFDPNTGQPLDKGIVQKYTPREFKNHESNNGFAGKKVTILHNPDKNDAGLKEAINTEKKIQGAISNDGEAIVSGKNGDAQIPLEKLGKKDLADRYNALYAEKANETWNKKELIEKINEKLNFLEEEKKAAEEKTEQDELEAKEKEADGNEQLV